MVFLPWYLPGKRQSPEKSPMLCRTAPHRKNSCSTSTVREQSDSNEIMATPAGARDLSGGLPGVDHIREHSWVSWANLVRTWFQYFSVQFSLPVPTS